MNSTAIGEVSLPSGFSPTDRDFSSCTLFTNLANYYDKYSVISDDYPQKTHVLLSVENIFTRELGHTNMCTTRISHRHSLFQGKVKFRHRTHEPKKLTPLEAQGPVVQIMEA